MKYFAKVKTWLSHECRYVEGEFETEFPKVGGKEMVLGKNIDLVKERKTRTKDDVTADAFQDVN